MLRNAKFCIALALSLTTFVVGFSSVAFAAKTVSLVMSEPEPEPDTKPQEKPEPDTKPEEKPEEKPDEKPEEKPDEKPEAAACTVTHGQLDIDVPSVLVSGSLTIGGAPFPQVSFDQGELLLQSCDDARDVVNLGKTGAADYSRRVVPGTYRPIYKALSAMTLPSNEEVVAGPCVDLTTSQVYDIDVPRIFLSGAFSISGQPFPAVAFEQGNFYLRDTETGGLVELGSSRDQGYGVTIVPGIYDVIWEHQQGDTLPQNRWATVASGVNLDSNTTFDIDITPAYFGGHVLWNKGNLPGVDFDDGVVGLENPSTGDYTEIANTHDGYYQTVVIEGTYDIVYDVESPGALAPRNSRGLVEANVFVESTEVLDIWLHSATVAGQFTLNGAAFPATEFDDALFFVRDTQTGALTEIGNSHDGGYTVELLEGSYEIVYALQSPGDTVPRNALSVVTEVFEVSGPTVKDVAVEAAELTGTIWMNGYLPPLNIFHSGWLFAVDTQTGDSVELGRTHDFFFSRTLTSGTYDIYYSGNGSSQIPANQGVRILEGLVVDGDTWVDIDIEANTLWGSLSQNGIIFPLISSHRGEMKLRDPATGNLVSLGDTVPSSYGQLVTPGVYDVIYSYDRGTFVPANTEAKVGCVDLRGPLF